MLISFIVWSNPLDYQPLDVPVLFLHAKYQNLWDDKDDRIQQKDNNNEFFLHNEVLCDVIKKKHRVREVTVQKYSLIIKFQDSVHSIILEPWWDPDKQAHQEGFMITNVDVDTVIQDWPTEWRVPGDVQMDQGGN